jgi:hypothetical protein
LRQPEDKTRVWLNVDRAVGGMITSSRAGQRNIGRDRIGVNRQLENGLLACSLDCCLGDIEGRGEE